MPRTDVVSQIRRQHPVDGHEINRERVETLLPQGSIEPLDVGVVVRAADSAVPVTHADLFAEVRGELGAVVGLDAAEEKRCGHLRALHEEEARSCVRFPRAPRIRPSRADIDEGVHVQLGLAVQGEVYRIDLNQSAGMVSKGPWQRSVPAFPRTSFANEALPIKGSLDRRERYRHAFFRECFVHDLRRAAQLKTLVDDLPHGCI